MWHGEGSKSAVRRPPHNEGNGSKCFERSAALRHTNRFEDSVRAHRQAPPPACGPAHLHPPLFDVRCSTSAFYIITLMIYVCSSGIIFVIIEKINLVHTTCIRSLVNFRESWGAYRSAANLVDSNNWRVSFCCRYCQISRQRTWCCLKQVSDLYISLFIGYRAKWSLFSVQKALLLLKKLNLNMRTVCGGGYYILLRWHLFLIPYHKFV